MTLYKFILKNSYLADDWQVLAIHSVFPLDFSEVFNGKIWDLVRRHELHCRQIVGYSRTDKNKIILMLEDIRK